MGQIFKRRNRRPVTVKRGTKRKTPNFYPSFYDDGGPVPPLPELIYEYDPAAGPFANPKSPFAGGKKYRKGNGFEDYMNYAFDNFYMGDRATLDSVMDWWNNGGESKWNALDAFENNSMDDKGLQDLAKLSREVALADLQAHQFDGSGLATPPTPSKTKKDRSGVFSKVAAGLSGAASLYGDFTDLNSVADTSLLDARRDELENMDYSGIGSASDALSAWNSTGFIRKPVTYRQMRGKSKGELALGVGKSIADGALTGLEVGGPWGALAGAVVGTGTGMAGLFTGNRRARRKKNEENDAIRLANADATNAYASSNENAFIKNYNSGLGTVLTAYGGRLFGRGRTKPAPDPQATRREPPRLSGPGPSLDDYVLRSTMQKLNRKESVPYIPIGEAEDGVRWSYLDWTDGMRTNFERFGNPYGVVSLNSGRFLDPEYGIDRYLKGYSPNGNIARYVPMLFEAALRKGFSFDDAVALAANIVSEIEDEKDYTVIKDVMNESKLSDSKDSLVVQRNLPREIYGWRAKDNNTIDGYRYYTAEPNDLRENPEKYETGKWRQYEHTTGPFQMSGVSIVDLDAYEAAVRDEAEKAKREGRSPNGISLKDYTVRDILPYSTLELYLARLRRKGLDNTIENYFDDYLTDNYNINMGIYKKGSRDKIFGEYGGGRALELLADPNTDIGTRTDIYSHLLQKAKNVNDPDYIAKKREVAEAVYRWLSDSYERHRPEDAEAAREAWGFYEDVPALEIASASGFPHANGGPIHIDPKNRGKFKEEAERAGQGVQEHARSVMRNPKATPLQRRRANFAINAAKWHHKMADGGLLREYK